MGEKYVSACCPPRNDNLGGEGGVPPHFLAAIAALYVVISLYLLIGLFVLTTSFNKFEFCIRPVIAYGRRLKCLFCLCHSSAIAASQLC